MPEGSDKPTPLVRDELQRLRDERDEARNSARHNSHGWKVAEGELQRYRAEVRRLTEGLREYGHHKLGCNQLKSPGLGRSPEFSGQECDCGLDALLSASPSDGGGA